MKNKKHLLALLFACMICSSCTGLSKHRVYEAYGNYLTAEQVEKVCKDYSKNYAEYYHIYHYFGIYNEKVHVMAVHLDIPGSASPCVLENFYIANTYVCSLPDPSYSLIAWIEGEGAWSLKKAYEDGKVSKDDIKKIAKTLDGTSLRKYGHLAVPLEEFTFSLAWGPDYKYYYESKDGGFLTTLNGESVIPAEYYASFEYPNLERVYEKAKHMSIYCYDTNAYEGSEDISSRMNDFKITLDDKEIEMTNVPNIDSGSEYPSYGIEGLFPIVFEIRDTIMNSDQWKSLAGHD